MQSHYRAAFFALLESQPARKALNSVILKCVRQEISAWMKQSNNCLTTDSTVSVSLKEIEIFDIQQTLHTLEMSAPLVSTCLNGMLEKLRRKKRSVPYIHNEILPKNETYMSNNDLQNARNFNVK